MARTCLALVPAPPATAALITSRPGFAALAAAIIACSAASSDPEVHHENTSILPVAAAFAGAVPTASASATAENAATLTFPFPLNLFSPYSGPNPQGEDSIIASNWFF